MGSNFGLPYMGSKAKIAESISMLFPKAENFYDLFGGGFSITHCMLVNHAHKFKEFHFNEIQSGIVELVKKAINGDFNYNKFLPKFVSRGEFFEKKDTDFYIRCCWSFGNCGKKYLFGEDIEDYKRSMHNSVIFNEFDETAFVVFGFREWPKNINTITKKRFYLRQKIEWFRVKKKIPKELYKYIKNFNADTQRQLQLLQQLQYLEQLQQLERLQQLQQLERLQQLQRLQQLEQLEQLERLELTSLDYRDVNIKKNSVVYCDIPYQGTADYGEFNHKEFFDWAATRTFPVYVSEYNIKDSRFELVYTIDKRALLSAKKENKIMEEKVYWNRVKL